MPIVHQIQLDREEEEMKQARAEGDEQDRELQAEVAKEADESR